MRVMNEAEMMACREPLQPFHDRCNAADIGTTAMFQGIDGPSLSGTVKRKMKEKTAS